MALPHSQDEGHVFSGIKSMIYSFLVPCYKWLLRVKLRGEAGLMNGFCLPLYYFLLFLQRSQLKKKEKKGKKLRTNCPEQSTDNLQSGSVTQIYITYLLAEFWLPPNLKWVCGFFIFHGTGPFVKEALWVIIWALEPVHLGLICGFIYWLLALEELFNSTVPQFPHL